MADLLDRIIYLTPERVCHDWGACLDIDEVEQFFAGRDSTTLRNLLQEPVAPEHLLWLVLRPEIIPKHHLHELGCRYAEYIIEALGEEPDPRSVDAIKTKRAWLAATGTPQMVAQEAALLAAQKAVQKAAREAAWEAAREAAWGAAQDVVRADARATAWRVAWWAALAAREAAWEAAWEVARAAAWEAAWKAAREMAWGAAWEKLMKITAEYLKESDDD